MIRVNTQHSTYEIDTTNRRIRRVKGSALPTKRQGDDNVWKQYHYLTKVLGGCYLIDWDGEGHCTLTSRVLSEENLSPTQTTRKAVS